MKKRILSLFLCGLLGFSISMHGQWEDYHVVAPYGDSYVMFSAKPLLEDLTDTKIEILLKLEIWKWKMFTGLVILTVGVCGLAYIISAYENENLKKKSKNSTATNEELIAPAS